MSSECNYCFPFWHSQVCDFVEQSPKSWQTLSPTNNIDVREVIILCSKNAIKKFLPKANFLNEKTVQLAKTFRICIVLRSVETVDFE